MSRKRNRFFAKRKRPFLMSEKEKKDYVTNSILNTIEKQREHIYGIAPKKTEEPETDSPGTENE
jgi:hypothetical protein